MANLLEWDNSEKAATLKRYAQEKKDKKETLYKSKYGKKRYKDFMKKDAEGKAKSGVKNPKGVRALHKGKWGYMKDRKFTADK